METPPLHTFLFLITFLAVFGVLVMTIPMGFIEATDEYTQRDIPTEEYHVQNLEAYASVWELTMNETGGNSIGGLYYDVNFEIGGHACYIRYKCANKSNLDLFIMHKYTLWGFWPTAHRMDWKNRINVERGDILTVEEIESDYGEYLPYDCSCSHFYMDASFNYNETLYSSVEDAWDHHGLTFFIGIEFDQLATGLNAWNLIAMILFFQMPNVHPLLNYIIAIPIWISVAWLAFAFIIAVIKSLPFT